MNQPFSPAAVIFDFDGTLVDTIPLIVDSWNAAVREPLGRTFSPQEVISLFGVPEPEMLRRALPASRWQSAVEAYYRHYEAKHDDVKPFPGISELLQQITNAGIPIGVMTGKARITADISLRALNWTKLFRSVITGDEVREQKPHPEGVIKVAHEIGVTPSRCIFVGDSPVDIAAGRAAGMMTAAAAWHSHYLDELRKAGADVFCERPSDVARALGLQR
jgi:pyrophosphatase PpaX